MVPFPFEMTASLAEQSSLQRLETLWTKGRMHLCFNLALTGTPKTLFYTCPADTLRRAIKVSETLLISTEACLDRTQSTDAAGTLTTVYKYYREETSDPGDLEQWKIYGNKRKRLLLFCKVISCRTAARWQSTLKNLDGNKVPYQLKILPGLISKETLNHF